MSLNQFLRVAAQAFPARPAVSVGSAMLHDYESFARRVAALGSGLADALGLAPGARVACWLPNCAQYLELLWACWHAGLCVVPINAKLHPREVAYILGNVEAGACFVPGDGERARAQLAEAGPRPQAIIGIGSRHFDELAAHAPRPSTDAAPDAPAWIFYTSGTTGRPKGAILTHRSLIAASLRYCADIDFLDEQDAILHAAPISHASGLIAPAFVAKAANQVVPASGGFDAGEVIELLSCWNKVTLFGAPTIVSRLVTHPGIERARIEGLRTLLYGGAPMYLADLRQALAVLGPRLVNIYGQGESPCTGTFLSKAMHAQADHPDYEARLASVGIPRTGVEVRVVDDQDGDLPAGTPGEVLLRSDCNMAGYWRQEDATASALRGGWLHTGDVGVLDAHGFLTLKDRAKDLIISGGSNIYPREVEEALLRHEGVVEVSVVGRPSKEWGEDVIAFVVPREGARPSVEELEALCLASIARFKRPKQYVFVGQLPKNSYGKVLKTELRAQLAKDFP